MRRALWVLFWSVVSMVGGYHLLKGGLGEDASPVDKLAEVMSIVVANYVDSVDDQRSVENAIRGLLEELDPHSLYIAARDVQHANEPLTGSFEGIGVEFNILDDTIVVVAPIVGGPSEEVGIRAGDKIVRIDGKSAVGFTTDMVLKTLRGPEGTKVRVTIVRSGVKDPLEFVITRGKIPLYSVDAAYMINDSVGYVKVSRFAAPTPREFAKAIRELKHQGMRRLILDLRGNPGGYLKSAVLMADEFLPAGRIIMYAEGRARIREEYTATRSGMLETEPLAVIIDQGSASASEIISGAIQDWDRGVIVGRRSYGKGLVQEDFYLRDGSVLRLTVARYHTPSGRVIQRPYRHGRQGMLEYEMEMLRRWERGEYFSSDSIPVPDSLKYFTVGGRVVYGGGGIMPDVFVPLDTSEVSTYVNQLIAQGILSEFVLHYLDGQRQHLLEQYPSVADFIQSYRVTTNLMIDLMKAAKAAGLASPAFHEKRAFYRYGKRQVKALLARHLYGMNGYFQVVNLYDSDVRRALEILTTTAYNRILKSKIL